jgi:hypothetical protein
VDFPAAGVSQAKMVIHILEAFGNCNIPKYKSTVQGSRLERLI